MGNFLGDLLGPAYGWVIILLITLVFSFLLIIFYYHFDRYDPEPKMNLFLAFLVGIGVPVISIPVQLGFSSLIYYIFAFQSQFINIVILGPIVEELAKGLFLYLFLVKFRIDSPLDSFIYGVSVGAGFAFIENLIYGVNALVYDGFGAALTLTLFRGGFSIIGHPIYTGMFGFGLGAKRFGLVKMYSQNVQRAVLLHMSWNFTFVSQALFNIYDLLWLVLLVVIIGMSVILTYDLLVLGEKIDFQLHQSGYFNSDRRKYLIKESNS